MGSVGVADLEREVPGMRPEVVELLETGIACGPREVQGQREVVTQVAEQADRPREVREVALRHVGSFDRGPVRVEGGMVEAPTELDRDMAERQLLIEEARQALLCRGRSQRFLAGRAVVAMLGTHAEGAGERPVGLLAQVQVALESLVLEAGRDLA